MALRIGSNGSGNGTGIFVNRRVITGVENLSGQFNSDITLKLYFEKVQKRDGGDFEPTHMIFANFKKEDGVTGPGRIAGWGQAFKVALLLEKVGSFKGEINEDGTIPDDALESLIGKECFILSYPARHRDKGTKVTNNYQVVAGPQMWDKESRTLIPGDEWLKKEFQREMQGGYVKDFWAEAEPVSAHAMAEPGF
jgi:hypothetical protein